MNSMHYGYSLFDQFKFLLVKYVVHGYSGSYSNLHFVLPARAKKLRMHKKVWSSPGSGTGDLMMELCDLRLSRAAHILKWLEMFLLLQR